MFWTVIIIILVIAITLSVFRVIVGPSTWDRLLGASLICSKIIIIIVLFASLVDQSFYLDIALVFAMLGFVGTTSLATFLRKKK